MALVGCAGVVAVLLYRVKVLGCVYGSASVLGCICGWWWYYGSRGASLSEW